ncbi:MAG TPA: hypothetical protein VKQ05_03605 [Gemmatimonadales bacterium]|nr:hypothetical protein [Gemmatimonadales bacterium]
MASTSSRSESLQGVFARLKQMLQQQAPRFSVAEPGPVTLRSWRGELRGARIPVAWVEITKTYVSYHVMSAAMPQVRGALSKPLAARLQGRTCFNFTARGFIRA